MYNPTIREVWFPHHWPKSYVKEIMDKYQLVGYKGHQTIDTYYRGDYYHVCDRYILKIPVKLDRFDDLMHMWNYCIIPLNDTFNFALKMMRPRFDFGIITPRDELYRDKLIAHDINHLNKTNYKRHHPIYYLNN